MTRGKIASGLRSLAETRSITGVRWKDHLLRRAANRARSRDASNAHVRIERWVLEDANWQSIRANLGHPGQRTNLELCPDIYDYRFAEEGTLVVDFADRHVGGGCFTSEAFGVSEQLVAQSAEYAVCLTHGKYELGDDDAFTFQGVAIDQWWPREAAAREGWLRWQDVGDFCSKPLTIIAVNAPNMVSEWAYDETNAQSLQSLAKRTLLVFKAADVLGVPSVYSGLLGGGAYCGNRPLALLLHLLLKPDNTVLKLHHPILWTWSTYTVQCMEARLTCIVDGMLAELRNKRVVTLGDALNEILKWRLATSHCDRDILAEGRWQEN